MEKTWSDDDVRAFLLDYACDVRLPGWARLLLRLLLAVAAHRRDPDRTIGGDGDVYLERWHVIPRNPWCNVYLHRFLRSDDDGAMHDHPWRNISILLKGAYREHVPSLDRPMLRMAGDIAMRPATSVHRIELIGDRPVWTLFLTEPRVRDWGFHCPQGWRHWKDFTNPADGGATIGRGCE